MAYVNLFNDHTSYEEYVDSGAELSNVSHCIDEIEVHYNEAEHDYSKDYFTLESLEDNNTLTLQTRVGVPIGTFSGSTDGGNTWEVYSGSREVNITLNKNEKFLITGDTSNEFGRQVSSTKNFKVYGNINTLIIDDDFVYNYGFLGMFSGATGLIDAENLVLSPTGLSCGCYAQMFKGCTNLLKGPSIIPALDMPGGGNCYQMFYGCTSLVAGPELPATGVSCVWQDDTLSTDTQMIGSYREMFSGCVRLKTAPALPATSLDHNCYDSMFEGCTSLTTAPDLLVTSTNALRIYRRMFYGCSKLSYIKMMMIRPEFDATNGTMTNWVHGVAENGTFVKNSAARWNVPGDSGVPVGWEVTTADE